MKMKNVVFVGCGGRLQPEPCGEQHGATVNPAGAQRSTCKARRVDRERSWGEGEVQTQSKNANMNRAFSSTIFFLIAIAKHIYRGGLYLHLRTCHDAMHSLLVWMDFVQMEL